MSHHESEDGGGYPAGLAGKDIPPGAKILALADRYCACVFREEYPANRSCPARRCAKFFWRGEKASIPLLRPTLSRCSGIYPPGTMVRLNNGEIGVVSRKGEGAATPIVHALVGPRGVPLSIPVRRDTASEPFAIKEALHADQANIRFSMHQVWGNEASL